MIKRGRYKIGRSWLVFGAILTVMVPHGGGQSVETSLQSTLNDLKKSLSSEYGPIRFHREEDLEDRLFRLSGQHKPYIYRLEPDDIGPLQTGDTVWIPNRLPLMYVAVLSDQRKAYELAGFDQAEKSFSDLVQAMHEPFILKEHQAETRGLFCAEVVYGLAQKWWVDDPAKLQLLVAEHYLSAGNKDGLVNADRWSKARRKSEENLSIKTVHVSDYYVIHLPIFWAPVENTSLIKVKMYSIKVDQAGKCEMIDPPLISIK